MSIYKRPGSKFYWYKFTFDGELVQQSSKCTNKADARTVRDAHRTQLALGKIGIKPKKDAPAFGKAVNDFLAFAKVEHANQPATIRRYYFSCEILKKFFGKTRVDRIETKDVQKFVVWRSSQQSKKTRKLIARKTVNYDLFILKTIFRRLLDAGVLQKSPARAVRQLSEDQPAFHVITEDEEKRYLLACPPLLQDVATVMLETGMRCGEVYQLKRGDVYPDKKFLKVTKGKTKSSIRRVHLTEKALSILVYRLNKFDGQYLFPQNDKDGNKQTGTLNETHLRTVRRLKFNFRLYDCRHTFATRALESGVDLLTLASLLGHANLKMVSRYAHPSEQHKADAVRQIEEARKLKKAKAV